jgi:hypothetical protein
VVEESDEVARIYSNIIEHYGRSGVGRLEETTTARGLPGVAEEVGARAGVFLDRPEREEELGDYEGLPESGEAFIYVAMSRLKARRMARS